MYLLDFSPSAASPDICVGGGGGPGAVLLDQQVAALRRAVEGVIRPFYVPGSQVANTQHSAARCDYPRVTQVLFKPDIYVTVIAWTPFLCQGAQSVLHQVTSFSSSLLSIVIFHRCPGLAADPQQPGHLHAHGGVWSAQAGGARLQGRRLRDR